MGYFCYIVKCSDGTFYSGWTTNPERRVKEHNQGNRGARYTRQRRPVRLVYLEELPDRSAAMRRERYLKTLSRTRKEKLIQDQIAAGGSESTGV